MSRRRLWCFRQIGHHHQCHRISFVTQQPMIAADSRKNFRCFLAHLIFSSCSPIALLDLGRTHKDVFEFARCTPRRLWCRYYHRQGPCSVFYGPHHTLLNTETKSIIDYLINATSLNETLTKCLPQFCRMKFPI